MTTTSAKPNDRRRVLRRHILRATFGRIDNRTLIRDNAQLRPHQATATEGNGPYYIPDPPVRRDVREGREGVPLTLRVRVVDVHKTPQQGAATSIYLASSPDVEGTTGM